MQKGKQCIHRSAGNKSPRLLNPEGEAKGEVVGINQLDLEIAADKLVTRYAGGCRFCRMTGIVRILYPDHRLQYSHGDVPSIY
jgi:hypothetical protein